MSLHSMLICCLLSGNILNDHALYLSVLEIDAQGMRIKVFQDNLQDAVRYSSPQFQLGAAFHVANRSGIEAYFQRKVDVHINDKPVGFYLQDITVEGDSYWIFFKLTTQQKWKTVELKASYLMELFPDQTNVVKVLDTPTQYFRLTKFFPSCRFER